MIISKTNIEGLSILKPIIIEDNRGHFIETFKESNFELLGLKFIQDNEVSSRYGVIRGLHFQNPPFAQTKLIRVLQGSVLDVAIDLRKGSLTFGKVFSIVLSAKNNLQLLVPKGFAHGYGVLSKSATVFYKVDAPYSKEYDRGVYYDDFKIDWQIPLKDRIISEKDFQQPRFVDLISPF